MLFHIIGKLTIYIRSELLINTVCTFKSIESLFSDVSFECYEIRRWLQLAS